MFKNVISSTTSKPARCINLSTFSRRAGSLPISLLPSPKRLHRSLTSSNSYATRDGHQPTDSSQGSSKSLTAKQREYLDSALRVNHAGELAATLIYAAQTPPIIRAHPQLRPLMQHMFDQEAGHFKKFNELLARHRVRPTAMYPVWQVAATALGWGTAMMGREAAMACTEAVETEIGTHYNNQVRVLLQWIKEMDARGEQVESDVVELVEDIKRIRDEELEHLDSAVEHDAKNAQPYELLTNVIRGGCRAAIWITERV